MKRRDFLMASGLLLIGGKTVYDTVLKERKKTIRHEVFNHLKDYVYPIKSKWTYEYSPEENLEGRGIMIDEDTFMTVAHVVDGSHSRQRFLGMYVDIPLNVKTKEFKINNVKLEEILIDRENDIAIFNVPHNSYIQGGLKVFPYPRSDDVRVGDKVYLIGDARLEGSIIRESTVSSIGRYSLGGKYTKNTFSIGTGVIPGSSGTPVVNERKKLVGLVNYIVGYNLTFAKKIMWEDMIF